MSEIEISVSESDLDGQVERLVEETELGQYEAERYYTELRGRVVDELARLGYDWSTDVIDGFTHLVISVRLQTRDEVGDAGDVSIGEYVGLIDEV